MLRKIFREKDHYFFLRYFTKCRCIWSPGVEKKSALSFCACGMSFSKEFQVRKIMPFIFILENATSKWIAACYFDIQTEIFKQFHLNKVPFYFFLINHPVRHHHYYRQHLYQCFYRRTRHCIRICLQKQQHYYQTWS